MTARSDNNPAESTTDSERLHEMTAIIDNLIGMMSAGDIGTLKLEYGDLRLTLQSKDRSARGSKAVEPPGPANGPPEAPRDVEPPTSGHVVSAPMIGTFYVAPAPNEPPFVQAGDTVAEGQTIGIIEAMKIMNEIASDRAGTVIDVMASDGQTVEYGSPLVRVEPSEE